jgi:hypothetical protein
VPPVAHVEPADADAGAAALEGPGCAAGLARAAPGPVAGATRALADALEAAGIGVGHATLGVPGAGQAQRDWTQALGLVAVGFRRCSC